MRYLKQFESYNSWGEVMNFIRSKIVPDMDLFNSILDDMVEYGKENSVRMSDTPVRFFKKEYVDSFKLHSLDLYKGGLGSYQPKPDGIFVDDVWKAVGDMLVKYLSYRRNKDINNTLEYNHKLMREFDFNDFKEFYESLGYEMVVCIDLHTMFQFSGQSFYNQSKEYLEFEDMLQEIVGRMEQYFGLSYSMRNNLVIYASVSGKVNYIHLLFTSRN